MSLPTEKLQKGKICMSTNLMTFERELMTYRKFSSLLLCGHNLLHCVRIFVNKPQNLTANVFSHSNLNQISAIAF
jgi:hypothetical protein